MLIFDNKWYYIVYVLPAYYSHEYQKFEVYILFYQKKNKPSKFSLFIRNVFNWQKGSLDDRHCCKKVPTKTV